MPGGSVCRDPLSGPCPRERGSRRPARAGSMHYRRRSEHIAPHEALSQSCADTSPLARLAPVLEGEDLNKRDWPPAAGRAEAGERPSRAFGDDPGCA